MFVAHTSALPSRASPVSQRRELGLRENFSKAAVYSPLGNIDCVPACLPGSPHHVDKYGNLTGRLPCFKMVGGYHGDDDACAVATTTRLAKKLQPLDVMDRARETEFMGRYSGPEQISGK